MPRLIIDDQEIEVPEGTKVIDAAERLGIMIPRFCYHKALGAVGACRLCAVKFLHGPFKGVQMSCMIDAQDGMVVSTNDPEAVLFRKYVIEWLMINHPHDCPVCDEGGHCLLQDETVSGGHGIRRYSGPKRTYRDQYLGPLVQHEMNRCIQCYRCSRFYQEYSGYRDLGVMQIANRVYFGRFEDGVLESPFAGNLIDICPTGVYTDRPSRYRARRWDLERRPSVCIHCSLGCNIVAGGRFREILRHEARQNYAVNGWFICDRGRYGFPYTNLPERPRQARIGNAPAAMEEGITEAARHLARISREHGPQAVRCLGGLSSSLENISMLKHVCRSHGWPAPGFFTDNAIRETVRTAVSFLDQTIAVSMQEIESADFVLVLGLDPVNEAPVSALAIRRAFCKGVPVAVIDPRPVTLPLEFNHLPVPAGSIGDLASSLVAPLIGDEVTGTLGGRAAEFLDAARRAGQAAPNGHDEETLSQLRSALEKSRKPVIICGTGIGRARTVILAAGLVHLLRGAGKDARIFYTLPAANAFGAALLDDGEGDTLDQVVSAIEEGSVKALVLMEHDPFFAFPDPERLQQALASLDLLVVLDFIPSRAVETAHVFLPTQTIYEMDASFINQEGRLQRALQVHAGGLPIRQESGGGHPLRVFRSGSPGTDPRPAWSLLSEIALNTFLPQTHLAETLPSKVMQLMVPGHGEQEGGTEQDAGRRILPLAASASPFDRMDAFLPQDNQPRGEAVLALLITDQTFGTEYLASFSPALQQVEGGPCLFLHAADGGREGLSDGQPAVIQIPGEPEGLLEVTVRLRESMSPGTAVLPRHRKLDRDTLNRLGGELPSGRIQPR